MEEVALLKGQAQFVCQGSHAVLRGADPRIKRAWSLQSLARFQKNACPGHVSAGNKIRDACKAPGAPNLDVFLREAGHRAVQNTAAARGALLYKGDGRARHAELNQLVGCSQASTSPK